MVWSLKWSKCCIIFRKERLTDIAMEFYDTGKIPEDLSKSIFTALPKSQVLQNVSYTALSAS